MRHLVMGLILGIVTTGAFAWAEHAVDPLLNQLEEHWLFDQRHEYLQRQYVPPLDPWHGWRVPIEPC